MKYFGAIVMVIVLSSIIPVFAEPLKPLGRLDWNAFKETEKIAYLRELYDANIHSESTTSKKFDAPFISTGQNVFLGVFEEHFLGSSPERLALDRMKYEQERRDRQKRQALLKGKTPSIRQLGQEGALLEEDLVALREALDGFYADYKNQRINAPSALGLIVLAMQRSAEKDVQQLTESLRANPLERRATTGRKSLPVAEYVSCPEGNACQLRLNNNVSLYHLWEVDAPQTNGQCPEEIQQAKDTIMAINDRLKSAKVIEVQQNGMVKGKEVINLYVDGENLNQWLIENSLAAKLVGEHNSNNWCVTEAKAAQ